MKNYHKNIALRLLAIKKINTEWQELAKKYGAKATSKLKEIAPSDPLILYDLSVISLIDNGITKEQAVEIVNNYSSDDWDQELEEAKQIIIYTINKALEGENE